MHIIINLCIIFTPVTSKRFFRCCDIRQRNSKSKYKGHTSTGPVIHTVCFILWRTFYSYCLMEWSYMKFISTMSPVQGSSLQLLLFMIMFHYAHAVEKYGQKAVVLVKTWSYVWKDSAIIRYVGGWCVTAPKRRKKFVSLANKQEWFYNAKLLHKKWVSFFH
jgi:hypothetical protein